MSEDSFLCFVDASARGDCARAGWRRRNREDAGYLLGKELGIDRVDISVMVMEMKEVL